MHKPLIGLTTSRHKFTGKTPGPDLLGSMLSDDYAQGVEAAGGTPLAIPYLETEDTLRQVAERMDGLLLTGGTDIDPLTFGEEPHVGLGDVYPERDRLEFLLIDAALQRGKPILGICRGMQVLNAAMGGTLYQDLSREWQGRIQHSQCAARAHLSHTVHVEPGSLLARLLDDQKSLRTNSFHHQAVRAVAPSLTAVAWDDEGLIEGVESKNHPFVVAVQWHPENLWRTSPIFLGLFQGLVQAAADAAVRDIGLARYDGVAYGEWANVSIHSVDAPPDAPPDSTSLS